MPSGETLSGVRSALERASAPIAALLHRRESARARALADELLLWGAVPRASSPLLARRAEELTSATNRITLARCARRLLGELDGPRCRAYAANRFAMRASRHRLTTLAERLESIERPASPAGVVLAERLLRDGAGPFYDPARADELAPAIAAALRALEGDSVGT